MALWNHYSYNKDMVSVCLSLNQAKLRDQFMKLCTKLADITRTITYLLPFRFFRLCQDDADRLQNVIIKKYNER